MCKAKDDREIDKKEVHRTREACIDAKNAKSNFSDLTKFCQRIKSINM